MPPRPGATGRRWTSPRSRRATDLVTAHDHAAEETIVARLAGVRPDDAIVGEEGTAPGRGRPACHGSSTRSTARRTSCTACRSGRRRSRPVPAARRWPARCTSRRSVSCSPALAGAARPSTATRSRAAAAPMSSLALVATGFGYRPDDAAARLRVVAQVSGRCVTSAGSVRRRSTSATTACGRVRRLLRGRTEPMGRRRRRAHRPGGRVPQRRLRRWPAGRQPAARGRAGDLRRPRPPDLGGGLTARAGSVRAEAARDRASWARWEPESWPLRTTSGSARQ